MIGIFGRYDVVVAGAGVTGVTAAISAARAGARVLLLEGSGFIGGNVTAGRLTKPTGTIEAGIFHEIMRRAADHGGADVSSQATNWGSFTGMFDPETILRVMIEMLEEADVEILLHAQVTGVVTETGVAGLQILVKSGPKIVLARVVIDASGDGDVAALAGAGFFLGREADGLMQPISCYIRMINADIPALARYVRDNPGEFTSVVLPEAHSDDPADYVFRFLASGFHSLIEAGRKTGEWPMAKNYLTVKSGMLPGEINLNITRFQGNALDERTLSRAEIEIRKQAHASVDFMRKYIPGCGAAALLDIAPKLGVRETRRIKGDAVLTGQDVQGGARFADSIGYAQAPIDVHEPGGAGGGIVAAAAGYDVPYGCLLPAGVDGLLMAGRCISVDEVAFGSTRNIPVCVLTGEAAGVAAALSARESVSPRRLPVTLVQAELAQRGLALHAS